MGRIHKYILPVIYFVSLFYNTTAQKHNIDSLWGCLKKAAPNRSRADALNYLSYLLESAGNFSQSDSLAAEALKLSIKINYEKGTAIAYTNIASYYDDKNDFNNALQYYGKALNIKERIGDKRGAANSLNGIGLIYEKRADYYQAMGYYLSALRICRETGDSLRCANALSNIGNVYQKQSDFPKALQSEFEALRIREQAHDTNGIATSFEVAGNCYYNMNNYTRALDYYSKALKIKEKEGDEPAVASLFLNSGLAYSALNNNQVALEQFNRALEIDKMAGDSLGTAICFNHIGESYHKQKQYTKALAYCIKGLNLFKKLGYEQGVASSLQDIGACYTFLKDYKQAENYENKAIEVGNRIGALQVVLTANYVMSNMYDSAGEPQKSLDYYKTYIVFRDSVYNVVNTKKSTEAEMNYEFDKKLDKEKFAEDKKNAVAEQQRKRDLIVLYALSVGLVLVLALTFFILRGYRQKERANELISSQKALVEQKNKDILSSITYAKHLQDAILPPLSEIKQYFPESFLLYKPKDIVAGDFYWVAVPPQGGSGAVLIAACDCTGHGVPGALVSVVCSNALNRAVKEFNLTTPGKILDKTRDLVLETFQKSKGNIQDGMDVSLASVSRSPEGIQIQWAGAYNSLLYLENGVMKEINADKQPIGKHDKPTPFTTHTLTISAPAGGGQGHCTLYLFTDGYADQFGGALGKKFKYKQLHELLLANAHKSMHEQGAILDETLEAWKGTLEQVDDILVIGIKI